MKSAQSIKYALLTGTLMALSMAARADMTLVREEIISPSVFGGTDDMISTIFVKGGNTRVDQHIFLVRGEWSQLITNERYIIDSEAKQEYIFADLPDHTYNANAYQPDQTAAPGTQAAPPAVVTGIAKNKIFLGHVCHGYHIVKFTPTKYYTSFTADVYVATDLPPIDVFSQHGGAFGEAADAFLQIGGTPLHMDMTATRRTGQTVHFTLDVAAFSTKPVSSQAFSIPKDYALVASPPPPAAYQPPDAQKTQGK